MIPRSGKIPHVLEQGRPRHTAPGACTLQREKSLMRRLHSATTELSACLHLFSTAPHCPPLEKDHMPNKDPAPPKTNLHRDSESSRCLHRELRDGATPLMGSLSSTKALSQVHGETSFMKIQVDKTFYTYVKAPNAYFVFTKKTY